MGQNLTGQLISATYEDLVQISGSRLTDGTGSNINNLTVTASNATTASFALNAAGVANTLTTASISNATITFTKGDATTFGITVNNVASASTSTSASFANTASFLLGSIATASYALNAADAELLDGNDGTYYRNASNINAGTLATARLSGSYTINVTGSLLGTASFATTAASTPTSTSASYAADADLLDSQDGTFYRNANNINGGTLSSARLAGTYTIDIAGNASTATTATTASFASTIANGLNINANTVTASSATFVNLVATSASFGYVNTTTGSAVIIGEQFIILNADSPAARYAGIQVYDSGSGLTGSFEYDSVGDDWIQVNTSGQSAGFLTGISGSKGSETYPTNNTILKGSGNHTVKNSIITDDGSTVTVAGTVSASVFVGNLNGNASTATTASFAISASFAPDTTFPFTGDARITGSLTITGSNSTAFNPILSWTRADGVEKGILTTNSNGAAVYGNRANGLLYLGVNQSGQQDLIVLGAVGAIGFYGLAGSSTAFSFYNNMTDGADFRRPLKVSGSLTVSGSTNLNGRLAFSNTSSSIYAGGVIISDYTGSMTSQKYVLIGNNINDVSETGIDNVQIGNFSRIVNGGRNNIVVIGANSSAAQDSVCIGGSSEANVADGVAVGKSARVNNDNTVAIGSNVTVTGVGAIGIGKSITTSNQDEINIGNKFRFNSGSNGIINLVDDTSISGSLTISNSAIITGSVRGEVRALTIASNTASLDCSLDNFYTLQLVSGSNTFINPSNILPGQTINLRVNTTGSATVSFPTSVKQVTGSAYVPTTTTGVDVVTFISFDATSLLLSNVKNLV